MRWFKDRLNRIHDNHMLPLIARQGGCPGGQAPGWPGYQAMPGCFVSGCQTAPSKASWYCSWHLLGWPCGENWGLLGYPTPCCPACKDNIHQTIYFFHTDCQYDFRHTWRAVLCANSRQQYRNNSETAKWCWDC